MDNFIRFNIVCSECGKKIDQWTKQLQGPYSGTIKRVIFCESCNTYTGFTYRIGKDNNVFDIIYDDSFLKRKKASYSFGITAKPKSKNMRDF